MGLGGCIRDSRGNFVVGFSKPKLKAASVLGAELEALREGINFASIWGFVPCVLESDSRTAISLMCSRDPVTAEEGFTIDDIRAMVGRSSSIFSFIRRSGNCVAHCLARCNLLSSYPATWLNGPPLCIASPLKADLAFSHSGR